MCNHLMYADDLKIYRCISSFTDHMLIQSDINNLIMWCSLNHLTLNASKCKVVAFHRTRQELVYNYSISGIDLERVESIQDLGIYFDKSLSFKTHISFVTSSAYKMLGFIKRNCKQFNNIDSLKLLYTSLVRSRLEYGATIWYPYYAIHQQSIEKVQRNFAKYLLYKISGEYPARGYDHSTLLGEVSLYSIVHRITLAQIKFLFHLIHMNITSDELLSKIPIHVPHVNTRFPAIFYTKKYRTNIGHLSPISNACNSYNIYCKDRDLFSESLRYLLLAVSEQFKH